MAGLAYELTWTRYLALLVGHAAFAQVLVLAVFLGGTAVGSLLAAERSRSLERPLRAYALVEAVLGGFGIIFHLLYLAGAGVLYELVLPALGEGWSSGVAIWTIAIMLILPQAVLLGTTFPLMAAGVVRLRPGAPGRSVADVYLLNTLGGAAGVLLGGFALVPVIGLPGAAAVAGVLNLTASALAYRADRLPRASAVTERTPSVAASPVRASVPLLLMATLLSALASFLYEIGWIRMLSLVLGSATHAFELMLSAFLLGLGTGSLLIRRWVDRAASPVRLLGVVQWAMGVAALLTLPLYTWSFPAMAWLVSALPKTDGGYLLFNLSRYALALVVMLPATLFAGMTLPLITGTLLRGGAGERVIGWAYSANTLGSVIGAVAGGLVLLPGLGLDGLLALGASMDIVIGVVLLVVAADLARRRMLIGAVGASAGVILVGGTMWFVDFDQALLTSGVYRSGALPDPGAREMLFYQDGATATVGAHRTLRGSVVITTNGKPDASLPSRWLQYAAGDDVPLLPLSGEGDETTQVLAPLITLAHQSAARYAAVIGQGSGMSSQLLLGDPHLESVVTIEIEPAMIEGSKAFLPANPRPFDDPRARFLLEDARRAMAQGGEPLDLVFSGPSNPWVSGVASLFTVQFYEMVRERLADGGVFGQWVHLYEMQDELVLSVLAGIDRTFPDWSAWLVSAADILVVAGEATDSLTRLERGSATWDQGRSWARSRADRRGVGEPLSVRPPNDGSLAERVARQHGSAASSGRAGRTRALPRSRRRRPVHVRGPPGQPAQDSCSRAHVSRAVRSHAHHRHRPAGATSAGGLVDHGRPQWGGAAGSAVASSRRRPDVLRKCARPWPTCGLETMVRPVRARRAGAPWTRRRMGRYDLLPEEQRLPECQPCPRRGASLGGVAQRVTRAGSRSRRGSGRPPTSHRRDCSATTATVSAGGCRRRRLPGSGKA